MATFSKRGVSDGKEANMKYSRYYGAILMGIMTWMAAPWTSATEYHYPGNLTQRMVKFKPYSDPGNGNYHSQYIELEPIDAKYFPDSPLNCATLEFHYCDKDGNDCRGKNRSENIDGEGGNFARFNYKKKGKLGDIDSLEFGWIVITNYEEWVEDHYGGFNRIYLESPQLDAVWRCYLVYNMGEHSWVSQEFGIRCGGKGQHAHCSQCFMPTTVSRNRTLAEMTAERLKTLERKDKEAQPEDTRIQQQMLSVDDLVGQDRILKSNIVIYSLKALPRAEAVGELKAGMVVSIVDKLAPKLLHVKFTTSSGRTYEGVAKLSDIQHSVPNQTLAQRLEEKAAAEKTAQSVVPKVELALGSSTNGETTVVFSDGYSENGGMLLLQNNSTTFIMHFSSGSSSLFVNINHDNSNKLLGICDEKFTSIPLDNDSFEENFDFTDNGRWVAPNQIFVLINNENRMLAVRLISMRRKIDGYNQDEIKIEYRIW